jgi:hypothetical protein
VIRLSVEGERLRVRLTPFEQLLGLRRSFEVPVARIADARVATRTEALAGRGFRAPGTDVPGLIALGTWRGPRGRQFWNVRRGRRVLVIDLRGGGLSRLVLQIPEPDAGAERLRRLAATSEHAGLASSSQARAGGPDGA